VKGIAVALGALLLAVAATSTAVAKAPPRVALQDCWLPSVKPDIVLLACGDGSESFDVARWTRWSPRGARAVGRASINDCTPSCVDGHVHTYRAVLLLDRGRMCGGRLLFTRTRLFLGTRAGSAQPVGAMLLCARS
jgi:hypothetical protein